MGKKSRADTRARTDKRTDGYAWMGPTSPGECKMWCSDEIISFWHPDRQTHTHTHTQGKTYTSSLCGLQSINQSTLKDTDLDAQPVDVLDIINDCHEVDCSSETGRELHHQLRVGCSHIITSRTHSSPVDMQTHNPHSRKALHDLWLTSFSAT